MDLGLLTNFGTYSIWIEHQFWSGSIDYSIKISIILAFDFLTLEWIWIVDCEYMFMHACWKSIQLKHLMQTNLIILSNIKAKQSRASNNTQDRLNLQWQYVTSTCSTFNVQHPAFNMFPFRWLVSYKTGCIVLTTCLLPIFLFPTLILNLKLIKNYLKSIIIIRIEGEHICIENILYLYLSV